MKYFKKNGRFVPPESTRPRRDANRRVAAATCRGLELLEDRRLFAAVPVTGAVPALSSNPTASVKVYLDFDGEAPTTWETLAVPATPAYDTDGDATTFNNTGDSNLHTEIDNIRQIWASVAEKFSPFNVDVTTVKPASFADNVGLRVVIGGGGEWVGTYGGWGGASSTGAFYNAASNTIYHFSEDFGGVVPWVSNNIAMQIGRSFGLQNQSVYDAMGVKTNQFNPGDSLKAPIMGDPNRSARSMWWYGASGISDYNFSTGKYVPRMQDDMVLIAGTNNGFGYRADDHGGSLANATALGTTLTRTGVIEKTSDVDYFSFTTSGGQATIKGDVAQYGAMLDLKMTVYNASGGVVASADSANLAETLTTNLPAGTYYVAVASHGAYGDVGQYTLTVTAPTSGGTAPAAPSGLYATGGNGVIALGWNDNSTNETGFAIQRSVDNGATWTTVKTVAAGVRTWSDNPVKTGSVQYRVSATGAGGSQSSYSAVATFNVKPADVNLDGVVSGDDYAILDFNFAAGGSGWSRGDVTLDGVISGDDYSALDYWIAAQILT